MNQERDELVLFGGEYYNGAKVETQNNIEYNLNKNYIFFIVLLKKLVLIDSRKIILQKVRIS